MPTLDLVYNPVSGSFRKDRMERLAAAFEQRGFSVEKLGTKADGAQLSGRADLICVHGGDGTLRDTIQAMMAQGIDVPLCIARSGTINLVARELDYPKDPEKLAQKVADAWARGPEGWVHSPLYTLGEMPIASCLSIGPDSHAVAQVSGTLKKRIGRFAYAVAMLRQLREWPRNPMTIRGEMAEGAGFECEAEAAIVSHGALYAGPFRLSPKAALAADSIELITLRRCTRLGMLGFVIAAMLRLPVEKFAFAEIRSCRRVAFDRCVTPVQVDGDHMPECAFAIGPSGRTIRYVV
ncbi:diacylglycerol kinase family protein [Altererythrobacter arenosus]|uniref:Diacylglycerol kinase family protein n=1 Tax=Altererythrobacter arenosus TaxID=3032592 RepID=A0ABY8FWT0_9SPHN|nr:diacylglycerol kinase family protein [Altererythrobacter sp. CAU 1644]WFL77866.1 diacylglycerol kinase family protein [Altererythrobacter sp. CAU 1644]